MFTGIIETTAEVLGKTSNSLKITRPTGFKDLKIGSSIAVAGACLSVIAFNRSAVTFNVVPETWEKTTLRSLPVGVFVNLERALRADSRLDGHFVQGHVEGVGKILNFKKQSNGKNNQEFRITISLPANLIKFIVPKGSIAVDGVSLTVAKITGKNCEIALIPHTMANTTLGKLEKGDYVNLESDILVRSVHAMMKGK